MPWIGSLLAWITAALGASVTRIFGLYYVFLVWSWARHLTIVTAFIVAWAAFFLGMVAAVKLLVLAIRVSMPVKMQAFTYFLPSEINYFIASLISIRLVHFVWEWTVANLAMYADMAGAVKAGGRGKYF